MTTTTFRSDIAYSSSRDDVETPRDYEEDYNISFTIEELVEYFKKKGVTIKNEENS